MAASESGPVAGQTLSSWPSGEASRSVSAGGPVQPGQQPSQPSGRRCDFAANVDGPWPRSRQEMARAMGLLVSVAEEAMAATAGRSGPARLGEVYVQGVWAAANWSVATLPDTPMTRVARPVSDRAIAYELELARSIVLNHDDPVPAAYAGGVLAWFTWLSGLADTVPYPSADSF